MSIMFNNKDRIMTTNNDIIHKARDMIEKQTDTISYQREEIKYLEKMVNTLKGIEDGDRERAEQYLLLSMKQSPICKRAVDYVLENELTPSDITLKKLTLTVKRKPRYDFERDTTGITAELY